MVNGQDEIGAKTHIEKHHLNFYDFHFSLRAHLHTNNLIFITMDNNGMDLISHFNNNRHIPTTHIQTMLDNNKLQNINNTGLHDCATI